MTPEELEKIEAEKAAAEKAKADELLKGLKLTPEQIEKLKGDSTMLEVLTHNLEAKRKANAEAKEAREKLEKLEADKKKAEEDALAKKGEYETLYKKSNDELEKLRASQKDLIIKKELEVFSIQNGLKKREYLKLFDTSKLTLDDNLNVVGLEETFKEFKEANSELFSTEKKITPDPTKPNNSNAPADELAKLKAQAEKTKSPRDIAVYLRAQKAAK